MCSSNYTYDVEYDIRYLAHELEDEGIINILDFSKKITHLTWDSLIITYPNYMSYDDYYEFVFKKQKQVVLKTLVSQKYVFAHTKTYSKEDAIFYVSMPIYNSSKSKFFGENINLIYLVTLKECKDTCQMLKKMQEYAAKKRIK
jgi:hypothetical protein